MDLKEIWAVFVLHDNQHPDSWISAWQLVNNPGFRIRSRIGFCGCWIPEEKPLNCHLHFLQTILKHHEIPFVDVIYLPDKINDYYRVYLRFVFQGKRFYLKIATHTGPPATSYKVSECYGVSVFDSDWLNKKIITIMAQAMGAFLVKQGGVMPESIDIQSLGDVTCFSHDLPAQYCVHIPFFIEQGLFEDKDGVFLGCEQPLSVPTPPKQVKPSIWNSRSRTQLLKWFTLKPKANELRKLKRHKMKRGEQLVKDNYGDKKIPYWVKKLREDQVKKEKVREFPEKLDCNYYSLFVTKSQVPGCNGLGVFAGEPIEGGSHIGVITGRLYPRKDQKRLDAASNIHTIYINDHKGNLFARKPGRRCAFRYLNKAINIKDPSSSPEANVTLFTPVFEGSELIGETYVRALRAIDQGEELLFSYDTCQSPVLPSIPMNWK